MSTAIIVTIASVLTALGTIIAISSKLSQYLAIRIGRFAVNYIRPEDLSPDSMIGESIKFKEEIAQSLESISVSMSEMQKDISKNRVDNLRIELLQLIHNTPHKAEVIEKVYSQYVAMGGNSYVKQVMNEWRAVHEKEVIRETIKNTKRISIARQNQKSKRK